MMPREVIASGPAERLDRWLRRELPGLSRRLAHALIADGSVRLDGRRAAKGALVRAGCRVTLPDSAALLPNPALAVPVLYEDASLIAVDKPGGLPSHPLQPRESETVVNYLLARYPDTAALAGGLVHRLDTGTSGILLAARSLETWTALRTAFRERTLGKRYLAVVAGRAPAEMTVDQPLAHHPGDRRRMVAARPGLRGWPALTTVRCLATDGRTSLVSIEMRTGVTHQIRVHLAGRGHPVLGDALYGGPPAGLPARRHALHAVDLRLPAYAGHAPLAIHCPLPADLGALVPSAGG